MSDLTENDPNLVFNRFTPKNLTPKQHDFIQKIVKKFILGMFICKKGGDILFSYQVDPKLKIDLISNFIAALSMFGEENVGQIKRMFIEGINIEMNIVTKYNLILVSFFHPNMIKDRLEDEAIKILDKFYLLFKDPIEQGKTNFGIYQKFDGEMCHFILGYLTRIGIYKANYEEMK